MPSMILGTGQGPKHLPPLQKAMEIIMFSLILEMWRRGASPPSARKNFWNRYVFRDFAGGAGRPSQPISSENIGNQHVFIHFGGGARAPVLPPPQTTMEIIPFLMILGGLGRAPITSHFYRTTGEIFTFQWLLGWAGAPISHRPKKWFWGLGRGSHNDFSGWAWAPVTTHLPKKLWTSLRSQWFWDLGRGPNEQVVRPVFPNTFRVWKTLIFKYVPKKYNSKNKNERK